MLAYQRGDESAFDELFARFSERVFGYFSRTLQNPETASDLFQQTFLRVHQARATYDPRRPFPSWLFSIAANIRKDDLKRSARRPGDGAAAGDDELVAVADDAPRADTLLDANRRVQQLELALARLPASQREVVILHKLEGLSFPEIASALGEHVEAVKARAFRGYQSLRKALDARQPS